MRLTSKKIQKAMDKLTSFGASNYQARQILMWVIFDKKTVMFCPRSKKIFIDKNLKMKRIPDFLEQHKKIQEKRKLQDMMMIDECATISYEAYSKIARKRITELSNVSWVQEKFYENKKQIINISEGQDGK